MKKIILSQKTRIIDYGQFSYTSKDHDLEQLIIPIPNSLNYIDSNAFSDCNKLTSIDIPFGVTYVGDGAFKECTSLKYVKWSENTQTILEDTFRECISLEKITIPANVKFIDDYAFLNCKNLKEITIAPDNIIKFIGSKAFEGCNSLNVIHINDEKNTGIVINELEKCIIDNKTKLFDIVTVDYMYNRKGISHG